MNLKKLIPAFEWLSTYKKSDFRFDFQAGLTVVVMLIPQGMAYALLAGMPPIYGLYAGIIPLVIYGLFGTSPHLSIGPVAVSALLVLAGISQVAAPMSEPYIELVILTGLLIGLMQILLAGLKLGFLVNFLSHPVIAGFTSAAAVIIIISQLKYLLGIEIPRFDHLHETIGYVFTHLKETHLLTFGLGFGGILLILILKKISKNIPDALLTVVLGILVVAYFKLNEKGIAIAGDIPQGLPSFIIPEFTFEKIKLVMPTVLTVTLIGIVESIGIAKAIESKHNYYKVRPNQELFALGLSKIVGAFFQSIPTSGSFSRSAINNEVGGRTGLSSVIAALLLTIALLFLMPLFYYLPQALLASIVILAVKNLFEYKEAIRLWKIHRSDFWMMMVTFVVTLALGIEEGVLAGVVLSVLTTILRSSRPHIAVLGRLPNTSYFRNIKRFPEAEQDEEVLIIRFDAPIYFANAEYFKSKITNLAKEEADNLKLVILDFSSVLEIDSTGLHAVEDVFSFLKNKKIQVHLCGAIGPIRDILQKSGLMQIIGEENQYLAIDDALDDYRGGCDAVVKNWKKAAVQTDEEE